MKIRLANYGDAGDLIQAVTEIFSDFWSAAQIEESLRGERTPVFVLEDDAANIRGFLFWRQGVDIDEIDLIAVAPELRRQGWARALWDYALESALSSDVVELELRADNTLAKRFYERLGFRFIRRRRAYYPAAVDALIFQWRSE
ncbi:MAG: GNAT family N-acetyltransferase [Eubacteriales bacterium]|nr:GNAT family N-acetyltransferase [Eubacteriales bacterium]